MALNPRNEKKNDPGDRRVDAIEFMQELTGIPARSIGSQIATMPPVPQPMSPLASVGQPPTDDPSLAVPSIADATSQTDVGSFNSPGVINGSDGSGETLVGTDGVRQGDDSLAAQTRTTDVTQTAATEEPDLSLDRSTIEFMTDPMVDHTSVDHTSGEEIVIPVTPEPTMVEESPNDAPDPGRYDGPLDLDVIAAGGNPMMSRRVDLTHEQKMSIATKTSSRKKDLREQRQERFDQRQSRNEPSPVAKTLASSPEVVVATQLFADPPTPPASSAPPVTASESSSPVAEQAEPVIDSPSPGPSPPNIAANVPMTTAGIEEIRQSITRETSQSQGSQQTIPVSPQPSTINRQTPNSTQVPFDQEPTFDLDMQSGNQVTQQAAASDAAIDQHNEVIDLIIQCLSRLTVASSTHRARLTTILDRLDSESHSNEYGEGDSSWMG